MKKFLVCLLSLAFALAATAQTRYSSESLTIPTVTVTGAISNGIGAKIDCRFQPNVTLSWTTLSTNWVARISSSVDNSNWQTNQFVIGNVDETLTPKTLVTNLVVNGIGWLRVDSVLNTGTIGATNTVSYGIKRY